MSRTGVAALIVCVAALAFSAVAASPEGMRLLVPAYFYPVPGGAWDSLTAAAGGVPITAIMNPENGPGSALDSDYVAAVTAFRAAGGTLLGYVYTSYATRSPALVWADVDSFLSWYPLDGIFVDEMTNDAVPAHLDYYEALYDTIKACGSTLLVMGNPGTNTLEEYLTRPAADVLVVFENENGYETYVPDSWTEDYCPGRFAHLAYEVASTTTMNNYVALAAARGAGYVYVTDDVLPNPWDTLPTYWTDLIDVADTTEAGPCVVGVHERGARAALRAWPNPFRDRVSVSWSAETPAGVLMVLDAQGRRVRRLSVVSGPDGVTWDGRDDLGKEVPSGVYWLRATGGAGSSLRVIRLAR